jgi:hypothetical protein
MRKEIDQNSKTIAIDLNSGENQVSLTLNRKADWSFIMKLPVLKFEKDAVNVSYNLNTYNLDRWVLWTGGSDLNPPILLWGVLVSLFVLALALAYLPTPLSILSWTLLLFGLSQTGMNSIVFIILTFMLIGFKSSIYKTDQNIKFYNSYQVLMIIMVFISIIILLMALRQGLLLNPEIFSNYQLIWFSEQMKDKSAWLISLPLWVYRSLMFIWAIWLAYSVAIWSKWIWNKFTHYNIWNKK